MKKKNLKKMKKQIAGALTVLFLAIAQFVYTEYFAPKPSSPERQIVTLDKFVFYILIHLNQQIKKSIWEKKLVSIQKINFKMHQV